MPSNGRNHYLVTGAWSSLHSGTLARSPTIFARRRLDPQPAKGHRPKTGRLGSETEAMTFQFLSGWRVPHSASDSPEQMKMMPVNSAQAPTSICCVERACAAFHTAQDSIVALTEGRDEIDITACEQHLARRDWAFKQVRAHVARTRSAWQAKVPSMRRKPCWGSIASGWRVRSPIQPRPSDCGYWIMLRKLLPCWISPPLSGFVGSCALTCRRAG